VTVSLAVRPLVHSRDLAPACQVTVKWSSALVGDEVGDEAVLVAHGDAEALVVVARDGEVVGALGEDQAVDDVERARGGLGGAAEGGTAGVPVVLRIAERERDVVAGDGLGRGRGEREGDVGADADAGALWLNTSADASRTLTMK
jgi:hypothetical protein